MDESSKEPTTPHGAAPRRPDIRFNFSCKVCGSVLEASASQSGAPGRCPTCSAVCSSPSVDPRTGLSLGLDDSGAAGQDPTPVHAYAAAGEKAPEIIELENGVRAIRCPRCSAGNAIEENFCGTCGFPFTIEGANRAAAPTADPYAVGAFIAGLISLPLSSCTDFYGGLVAFAAAVLAWASFNRVTAAGRALGGRRWAVAGLVMASIVITVALGRIVSRL